MNLFVKLKNKEDGIALILTILLMNLIFFLALFFLSFSLTEKKIANSQTWGVKTYYLAEAGVAEMIWKLKNDNNYQTNFETNPNWTAEFIRNNPFGPNSGLYTVTITNFEAAHGEIIAQGSLPIAGGNTSKRVIKTNIYKATGQSIIDENAIFANDDLEIKDSVVNIISASIHANKDVKIKDDSVLAVENDIEAVEEYSADGGTTVIVGGAIYDEDSVPPPENIDMPAIDFFSADPNSYKNRADIVYSEDDFEDLLADGENLTLDDGITYVEGKVKLPRNINLVVNGLLVIEDDFELCPEKGINIQTGSVCQYYKHIHYLFDWGIDTAVYLDIIFHGDSGDVTKRINFQDYVSGNKFDIGHITEIVDGEEQEIKKIHTHDMSPSSTILCTHINEGEITKTFDIEIDGVGITYYDENTYSNPYPGVTCESKAKSGDTGECEITINYVAGFPSGVLVNGKIKFTKNIKRVDIEGLVYATDDIEIKKIEDTGDTFDIIGSVVGYKVKTDNNTEPINITFNNDIVLEVFVPTEFSPIITIEHWEEEY